MGEFTTIDLVVFLLVLIISIMIGVYYAFINKQKTNSALLMGNRDMNLFAVSLSLLATFVSATIILGWTGEIYATGSILSNLILVALVYIPLGGILFLPTLYKLRMTSAYEYLEMRFKSRFVRLVAAISFTAQICIYMGVVLYAPSVGFSAVTGFPVYLIVIIVGTSASIYTSIGGFKAVVWTDVFQMFIMFIGLFAVVIQGTIRMGGLSNVFVVAEKHGRIEYLNWKVDPFTRHTTLNLFFGQGFMWLSGYGCHQTAVQRYCSMGSYKKAVQSILITAPLVALAMTLTVLSGIIIFANYAGCDPLTLGFIQTKDQIAPYFVLEHLSATPGLVGIFIGALFAGALSTISSGVNSLAAVTWEDFVKKIDYFDRMSEARQALSVKIIAFSYGMLTVAMAFVAESFTGILHAALVLFGSASGPLLGVFILGVWFPFCNKFGAAAGQLSALIITLWIGLGSMMLGLKPPHLGYSIDECKEDVLNSVNLTQILIRKNLTDVQPVDLDWPNKIYTVSYVLYPLIGTLVTVIVGSVVSLLTGPTRITRSNEKYLHPLIVYLNHKWEEYFGSEQGDALPRKKYTLSSYSVDTNGKHYPTPITANDNSGSDDVDWNRNDKGTRKHDYSLSTKL